MRNTLLFLAVILGLGVLFAAAQTHTFPALDTDPVSWTGAHSFAKQITSSLATGTAPFSIASTTQVTNLNAQLHGGLAAPASAIVGINDTQTLTAKTLTNPVASGLNMLSSNIVTGTLTLSANTSGIGGSGVAWSGTIPTINSGFGTSPSVTQPNDSIAFLVNVGTGGAATSGVINLGAVSNGWIVLCENTTTFSTTVFRTRQTATTATTATIGNFNSSAASAAWASGDVLACIATGH
jgi:hypothetical protein